MDEVSGSESQDGAQDMASALVHAVVSVYKCAGLVRAGCAVDSITGSESPKSASEVAVV